VEPKVKVGVIGCGAISAAYFTGCQAFDILEIVACADINLQVAHAAAERFGIPRVYSVDEMLHAPDIQLVINLTIPQAHAAVNQAVIAAGKHVYCEKPFAVTREEGLQTLAAAEERGVLVGCAPDTVLGGGVQTCRALIDNGVIGTPVAAVAFMMNHGPEGWHPNPGFYYQVGGGPMFDMGPYYLTTLVTLLGPIKRVTGANRMSFPERVATSKARFGERIKVEVPTHVGGLLEFEQGPIATIITSFDVWHTDLPRIEIYGSEGSLSVPDPNTFGGVVQVRRADDGAWTEVPLSHRDDVGRGIGVADMAYALVSGRPHRANGALAYHVLDAMHAFHDAAASGQHINLQSTCSQPAALPLGSVLS